MVWDESQARTKLDYRNRRGGIDFPVQILTASVDAGLNPPFHILFPEEANDSVGQLASMSLQRARGFDEALLFGSFRGDCIHQKDGRRDPA